VVEAKEVGRWSFRHSWRALNEVLPPNVHPITILRAFFATVPYISITILVGNSASNSILGSTGDGPWGSAPMGVIDPGPLLGCVVRVALGGVVEGMIGLSLEASLLLGPVSLSRSPPLCYPPFGNSAPGFRARSFARHYRVKFWNARNGDRVVGKYLSLRRAAWCTGCFFCELQRGLAMVAQRR
jgi:hypothetical protein